MVEKPKGEINMSLPKHTTKITDELMDMLKCQMKEVIYLAVSDKVDSWESNSIRLTNEQEKQIVTEACTAFIKQYYEPNRTN